MILELQSMPGHLHGRPHALKLSTSSDAKAAEFLRRRLRKPGEIYGSHYSDGVLRPIGFDESFARWPTNAPRPAVSFISDTLVLLHFCDHTALLGVAQEQSAIVLLPLVLDTPKIIRLSAKPVPLSWHVVQLDGTETFISRLGPIRSPGQGKDICRYQGDISIAKPISDPIDWFRDLLVKEATMWMDEWQRVRRMQPFAWPAPLCHIKKTCNTAQGVAYQTYINDICSYIADKYCISGRLGVSLSYPAPRQFAIETTSDIALLPNGALGASVDKTAITARIRSILTHEHFPFPDEKICTVITPAVGRIDFRSPKPVSVVGLSEVSLSQHRRLDIQARISRYEKV